MTPLKAPRGIRNNNPGNIDFNLHAPAWLGEIRPSADPRFCQFDTMAHGVRALAENFLAYHMRDHINTIQGAINRWAPSVENNTSAYVQAVAQGCGVHPQDVYPFTDNHHLCALCAAVIEHENGAPGGGSWVSDTDLLTGVTEALQAHGI